jgi:hypothetical protein
MSIKCSGLKDDIVGIIKYSVSIIFGRTDEEIKFALGLTDNRYYDLYKHLLSLIDEGKINEAENMMYDREEDSIAYLELMLSVYMYINERSDDELEINNYSRDEIYDGINMALKKYNCDSLTLI